MIRHFVFHQLQEDGQRRSVASRQNRLPRQQRRRTVPVSGREHDAEGLERGYRDQPDRNLPYVPRR